MDPKINSYISKSGWQDELEKLRAIISQCNLNEELKWGVPCYTFEKKNIILIHAFKEYCAVLFFKGALLNDPEGFLTQQTKNTQAARQMRFTDVRQIIKNATRLKQFIYEAIELEKIGAKVQFKKTKDFPIAEEFQNKLNALPELKAAFSALTPGRQKGYLLYFSQAKQSETRESRIQKCIPLILAGKGIKD